MAGLTDRIRSDLASTFGERLSVNKSDLEDHAALQHEESIPDAVIYPASNEEVRALLKYCNQERIPIIPYGAGTSLEGQVSAIKKSVCIDMKLMNSINTINKTDKTATVQAGVRRGQLDKALEHSSLFFPAGPSVNATIGGMISTRASGTNAVRYGTMRENVVSLTVCLADGRMIRTASEAKKSSSGYDLTRLFTGTEGTLGLITEAIIKLHSRPRIVSAALCFFNSLQSAVDGVIELISAVPEIAMVELLDEVMMNAINTYSSLNYPDLPAIFLEFHYDDVNLLLKNGDLERKLKKKEVEKFQWTTETERKKIWEARKNALPAIAALKPGTKILTTDVCVPLSKLAECLAAAKMDIEKSGLTAPLVGHVGDGNFHLGIIVDPGNKKEMNKARLLNRIIVERAIGMKGTCTGEHGIGIGKLAYMQQEHGEALSVMKEIKIALDPMNIMNPGKMIVIE